MRQTGAWGEKKEKLKTTEGRTVHQDSENVRWYCLQKTQLLDEILQATGEEGNPPGRPIIGAKKETDSKPLSQRPSTRRRSRSSL